jgi:transposase InsO family protein
MVDIIDGQSRYLVHWTLNLTMAARTVTPTVQEALEGLSGCKPGSAPLVRDHGSLFVRSQWRAFVPAVEGGDINTRGAPPQ